MYSFLHKFLPAVFPFIFSFYSSFFYCFPDILISWVLLMHPSRQPYFIYFFSFFINLLLLIPQVFSNHLSCPFFIYFYTFITYIYLLSKYYCIYFDYRFSVSYTVLHLSYYLFNHFCFSLLAHLLLSYQHIECIENHFAFLILFSTFASVFPLMIAPKCSYVQFFSHLLLFVVSRLFLLPYFLFYLY